MNEFKKIVGRCSICGGTVSVPLVYWSVIPSVPTCESCGAVLDETYNMPVVPMRPIPTRRYYDGTKDPYSTGNPPWYPPYIVTSNDNYYDPTQITFGNVEKTYGF